jgi:hypothetical protein
VAVHNQTTNLGWKEESQKLQVDFPPPASAVNKKRKLTSDPKDARYYPRL